MTAKKPRPSAPLEPAKRIPGAIPCWKAIIPGVPSSENVQRRSHFQTIRRENRHFLSHLRFAFSGVPKAKGVRTVLIVREGPGLLDEGDGLAGSYKGIRDALRPAEVHSGVYGPDTKTPGKRWVRKVDGIGMVIGDGPGQAVFQYAQRKVKAGEPLRTIIVIADGLVDLLTTA